MYVIFLFLSLFFAIFGAVAILYLLYNVITDKIVLLSFKWRKENGRELPIPQRGHPSDD
ncbi:MAG: hypothetical protein FWH05_07920 [Oscillospiraceae bacterium]|nr:hypothetical protein [Oscillospiraceae bacterium]